MNKLKVVYEENGTTSKGIMKFGKDENLDIVTVFSVFLDVMEDAEFQFDRNKVLESLRSDKTRFEVN